MKEMDVLYIFFCIPIKLGLCFYSRSKKRKLAPPAKQNGKAGKVCKRLTHKASSTPQRRVRTTPFSPIATVLLNYGCSYMWEIRTFYGIFFWSQSCHHGGNAQGHEEGMYVTCRSHACTKVYRPFGFKSIITIVQCCGGGANAINFVKNLQLLHKVL